MLEVLRRSSFQLSCPYQLDFLAHLVQIIYLFSLGLGAIGLGIFGGNGYGGGWRFVLFRGQLFDIFQHFLHAAFVIGNVAQFAEKFGVQVQGVHTHSSFIGSICKGTANRARGKINSFVFSCRRTACFADSDRQRCGCVKTPLVT